jgi:tRNA(Ile)-lysidine synthase
MDFNPDTLVERLCTLVPARRYLIAYSGGADSHVLLHALSLIREQLHAELLAVHVDHRLQPQSADWARHCAEVAVGYGIPFQAIQVQVETTGGESLEAAAREARYAALENTMQPGDAILTAHHQDDQAETLLIQLLRGAGPRGLSAMAAQTEFGSGWLLRPLLDHTRDELEAYAREVGFRWLEDPSNRDTRFDRNFLRHEVMPLLRGRWPSVTRTLGRAARHQVEAVALLDELALHDLGAGDELQGDTLPVTRLTDLSEARQKNLLRYWIHAQGYSLPDERRLAAILTDLLPAAEDANPLVCWSGGQLRRYRDTLYLQTALPMHEPALTLAWDGERQEIPSAGGVLKGVPSIGEGLKAASFSGHRVEIRFRAGGERCRPQGRGVTRDVKKLMQEAGIPPWLRGRIPLVYIDGELAAIPGVCVCESHAAGEGENGLVPRWNWRKAGHSD